MQNCVLTPKDDWCDESQRIWEDPKAGGLHTAFDDERDNGWMLWPFYTVKMKDHREKKKCLHYEPERPGTRAHAMLAPGSAISEP